MAKLLGRLVFLILICLVGYLYFQVQSLTRETASLRDQVAQLSALRTENRSLREKLAKRHVEVASAPTGIDWLGAARQHVQNAEQAAAKGDFGTAYRETQFANLAMSRAADAASSETRGSIQQLRTELQAIPTKAQSMLHGGG